MPKLGKSWRIMACPSYHSWRASSFQRWKRSRGRSFTVVSIGTIPLPLTKIGRKGQTSPTRTRTSDHETEEVACCRIHPYRCDVGMCPESYGSDPERAGEGSRIGSNTICSTAARIGD